MIELWETFLYMLDTEDDAGAASALQQQQQQTAVVTAAAAAKDGEDGDRDGAAPVSEGEGPASSQGQQAGAPATATDVALEQDS